MLGLPLALVEYSPLLFHSLLFSLSSFSGAVQKRRPPKDTNTTLTPHIRGTYSPVHVYETDDCKWALPPLPFTRFHNFHYFVLLVYKRQIYGWSQLDNPFAQRTTDRQHCCSTVPMLTWLTKHKAQGRPLKNICVHLLTLASTYPYLGPCVVSCVLCLCVCVCVDFNLLLYGCVLYLKNISIWGDPGNENISIICAFNQTFFKLINIIHIIVSYSSTT